VSTSADVAFRIHRQIVHPVELARDAAISVKRTDDLASFHATRLWGRLFLCSEPRDRLTQKFSKAASDETTPLAW
jgi:hypothetical protein